MATLHATRRRWFRFSMRTLLILVAILAVPVAWIGKERRQSTYERRVADVLISRGARSIDMRGPFDLKKQRSQSAAATWWRILSRQALGKRIVAIDANGSNCREIAPLGGLKSLRSLDLRNVALSDLNPLAGLTTLRYLTLDDTDVTDLTPLAGLHDLQWLSLNGLKVRDLTPLAGLTNLRSLTLDDTCVADITPLAGLERLEYLRLYGVKITDVSSLANLKNLQDLSLDNNRVSDITPLVGLTKLESLSVTRSRVAKEDVDAFRKALPTCKVNGAKSR